MTHGHELSGGDSWREWGYQVEGGKRKKIRTTVIAQSKNIFKKFIDFREKHQFVVLFIYAFIG